MTWIHNQHNHCTESLALVCVMITKDKDSIVVPSRATNTNYAGDINLQGCQRWRGASTRGGVWTVWLGNPSRSSSRWMLDEDRDFAER